MQEREELKAMFRVCVHIKKDGIRCNSPALKGGNFCFQHIGGSLREHTRARSIYNGPQLDFLYPGTRQAIQHNLFVVAQAMNDGKLELAQANTYNRIFSACERNLRRWEMQCKQSGPEPELVEVPDEALNEALNETPASNHSNTAPAMEQGAPVSSPSAVAKPDSAQTGLLSGHEDSPLNNGASAPAKGSPEPAQPNPSPDSSPDSSPESSPDSEPLVLTPEEIQRFTELETHYIDDPTLADRIRETYRQIYEQRLATKNQAQVPHPSAQSHRAKGWETPVR